MAGVPPSYDESFRDNQTGMAAQTPPNYTETTDKDTRQPTVDMRADVPSVEVHGNPTQLSQASLRNTSGMTSEELQELQEKTKREQAKKYFSLREGQFEIALEECKTVLDPERDGKIINAYLLTEIDHWDHEKERFVIITEKQLVIIKYNFIGLRVEDDRKIPLIKCDKIQTGRFIYPKNTMMIPRHYQVGLRIYTGKNQKVTALQNWNPWSKEIPFITFGRHRGSELKDRIPRYMELNYFEQEIISAIKSAQNELHPGAADNSLEFISDPILIEVYCGASPIVHNWGILGYGRDRGSFGLTGYADKNPRLLQHGVRIHLTRVEPSLFQNWNPWNSEMPYISFTDHQSMQLHDDPPPRLSIKSFQRSFIDSINAARVAEVNKQLLHNFEVTEEELPIYIYVGLSAMVVNQSKLGFCKDRGSVFY